jgi:hypothetical protein
VCGFQWAKQWLSGGKHIKPHSRKRRSEIFMNRKNSRRTIKNSAMVAGAPVALAVGLLAAAPAQAAVIDIRVDFQPNTGNGTSAGGNWNTVALSSGNASYLNNNLTDFQTGLGTNISLETPRLRGLDIPNSYFPAGASSTAATWDVDAALKDGVCTGFGLTSTLTIGNLSTDYRYTVEVIAYINHPPVGTSTFKLAYNGGDSSYEWNEHNNLGVMTWTDKTPNSSGQLVLTIGKTDPSIDTLMNAMRITSVAIPEPATIAGVAGLGSLALLRRRRNRK